jgi:hypothetical protein
MNVIGESQPGDELTIIQEFHVSPSGERFSWKTSRNFRVGERVRYVSFLQDRHGRDIPGLGWMVLFEADDGKRYAATQTYFVNDACLEDLRKLFAKRSAPKSRRARTARS